MTDILSMSNGKDDVVVANKCGFGKNGTNTLLRLIRSKYRFSSNIINVEEVLIVHVCVHVSIIYANHKY